MRGVLFLEKRANFNSENEQKNLKRYGRETNN